jgi:hypothetical protein
MPFEPGDHLRDHRRRFGVPYTHHAIKVHDERVIEFGGSTADKAAMGIACSPYERFATGRKVDLVQHDDHDAALTVQRAEWLLSCPPTRRYNGIGFMSPDGARPAGKPRAFKYDTASSAANTCWLACRLRSGWHGRSERMSDYPTGRG